MSASANDDTGPDAPDATPPADRLWTVGDVASFLRMSISWTYKAAADGTLPALPIGGAVRFAPEEIRRWALAQAVRPKVA